MRPVVYLCFSWMNDAFIMLYMCYLWQGVLSCINVIYVCKLPDDI